MRKKEEIICGIYKITTPNEMIYIGASVNIKRRWSNHKCKSTLRFFKSKVTQSIIEYGVKCHKFEILEECEKYKLYERECFYINIIKSQNPNYLLNSKDGGGNFGLQSKESRNKMRRNIKPVILTKHNGETLRFDSIRDAYLDLKINNGIIYNNLNGLSTTTKLGTWKYE